MNFLQNSKNNRRASSEILNPFRSYFWYHDLLIMHQLLVFSTSFIFLQSTKVWARYKDQEEIIEWCGKSTVCAIIVAFLYVVVPQAAIHSFLVYTLVRWGWPLINYIDQFIMELKRREWSASERTNEWTSSKQRKYLSRNQDQTKKIYNINKFSLEIINYKSKKIK